jgi:hypothetical protein
MENAWTHPLNADFIDNATFIETRDGVVHLMGGASLSSLNGRRTRWMRWVDRHIVDVVIPLAGSMILSGVALWGTLALVG